MQANHRFVDLPIPRFLAEVQSTHRFVVELQASKRFCTSRFLDFLLKCSQVIDFQISPHFARRRSCPGGVQGRSRRSGLIWSDQTQLVQIKLNLQGASDVKSD